MDTPKLLSILERANHISSTSELDDLLERMLDLILEVCGAETGTLYLLDRARQELVFRVIRNGEQDRSLVGKRMKIDAGLAGAAVSERRPILVEDVHQDPRWNQSFARLGGRQLHNALTFPLLLHAEPIGVIQVFNFKEAELEIVQLLGNRMASEVDKALLLQASRKSEQRLQALVKIVGSLSASLDPDEVLQQITDYACQLLNAEAASLFLVDPESGNLRMQFTDTHQGNPLTDLEVPAGQGVIGHTIQTGTTMIVSDAHSDPRHYSQLDKQTGFQTRSLIAVPLRSQRVNLGQQRGAAEEQIVGGLEGLNKRNEDFNQEDARLLESLADFAATALQKARLYADANQLFMEVIDSLMAAIDAKDPYTQGHSQRVRDFSAAIAREMNLPAEMVHHVRLAGLMHDIGKIGIPDTILKKPERLTQEEYEQIKKHPEIGANILRPVRLMKHELPGIEEHHERVDGRGYPRHLSGEEISLIGRIVCVADAFDALTSDRDYRPASPAREALRILEKDTNTYFDPACVLALVRAYDLGQIHTQRSL